MLQPILVLAIAVALVSLVSTGFLQSESWNEFDVLVQELGWSEEAVVSPTSDAALEVRITEIPGQTGGGPPPPGLNSFEDFETGFNTWINTAVGDDNDCWRLESTNARTSMTGPEPPIGAAGTTFYVYYESSGTGGGCSPNPAPKEAFLVGPTIDFDAFNDVTVDFSYHMFGNTMGTLELQLETGMGTGVFANIFSDSGEQGNQWNTATTIDLSSEDNTGSRQLRFVATETVNGFRSDMAVDEILIQGVAAPLSISFEDYESGFNTWINTAVGDDNDCWKHRDNPTPTSNTGPNGAAPNTGAPSTGQPLGTEWFVFYESSNGCSPGAGQQAFLAGPTIDFTAFNGIEVTFWRHMWDGSGPDNVGRLALELEDSPGSGTFTEIWFQQGNQGNQWDQITVDLTAEDNSGPRQFRFVATEVVAGVQSDMAVDEILIQGTATPAPLNLITSCVFHSDEDIPEATDLSQGTAICKLLDAPHDQGGKAIAEGRAFFESYTGSDDLEVLITQFAFENSNNNQLIFDVKFIIEAPV